MIEQRPNAQISRGGFKALHAKKSEGMSLAQALTMTLVGGAWLALVLVGVVLPFVWRTFVYRPVEGTVIEKRLARAPTKRGFHYRLEALLQYEAPPEQHEAWVTLPGLSTTDQRPEVDPVLNQVAVGQKIPAFYDPYHPDTLVLERGTWGLGMIPGLLCPSVLLLFGVAGLVSLWRRRKRMAADTPGVITAAASGQWNQADEVAVDQGQRLQVRLRSDADKAAGGSCCFGVWLAFLVAMLLATFTHSWRAVLPPGVWPGMLLSAFLLICFVSIQVERLVRRRLRPFTLEVSRHPLRSGESFQVSVAHPDPVLLSRVRLQLKCKQHANDRRAPQVRTTFQRVTLDETGETVRTGRVDLPAGLPPTMKLSHHDVEWWFQAGVGRWLRWPLRFPVQLESGVLAEKIRQASTNRLDDDCVSLWIDTDGPVSAGTNLTGGYTIRPRGTGPLRSAELSILWYTPPPGAEDRDVFHKEEHMAVDGDDGPLYATRRFEVSLPDGPPSCEGKAVSIRWVVRLRLRYADGQEVVRELSFAFTGAISPESQPAAAVPPAVAHARGSLHPPPSTRRPEASFSRRLPPPGRGFPPPSTLRPPPFSPVEAIQLPWGVRYPVPRATAHWGCLVTLIGLTAVPLWGAWLAGQFLQRNAAVLPPVLVMLSCLFIVQIIYLALMPIRIFAWMLWREAVGTLGGFELELRGERLATVARIGPVRLRISRSLRGLERFVVQHSPPMPTAGATPESGKSKEGQLYFEREGKAPVRLLYDYPPAYLVELAEDLRKRIQASADFGVSFGELQPVAVVKLGQKSSLDRHEAARELRRRRFCRWTIHLGGVVGLGALTAAVDRTGGFSSAGTWILFAIAWVLAIALFWGARGRGTK